jgi:hypothetical protein
MRVRNCIATIAVLVAPLWAIQYSKENQKTLEAIFKQSFKDYYFHGSPASTFGVGTMYLDEKHTSIENRWLVGRPESWFAKSLKPEEKSTWLSRIIVEGDLGSRDLTDGGRQRDLHLDVAIPKIGDLLSGGANVDWNRDVKIEAHAAKLSSRKLNWLEFTNAKNSGALDPSIVKTLEDGNVTIAAADVVATGYNITIDPGANAGLTVKLNATAGKTTTNKGTANFSVSAIDHGKFVLKADSAVVLAVLFKKPPQRKNRAGGVLWPSDINAWVSTSISGNAVVYGMAHPK